jgi:glycosyltransferase involved in cell wall biosynthesis
MSNWASGTAGPLTSLVLPTYNPGATLERTWFTLKHFLDESCENWEILFVCDGCSDGSPARLAEWARDYTGQVQVLSYAANRGKGHAVRLGLEAARGRWRLFTDVDLAYGLEDIQRVARTLRDGAGVVIASRRHPASQMLIPARLCGYVYRRHVQSLVFSSLVRLLLPIKQFDTQAGLKGLTAEAARTLLPHLCCDGFGFDCELLTAAARLGVPVTEVPVCVRLDSPASTTSAATLGRMVAELWRIRRAWRHVKMQHATQSVDSDRRAA